MNEIIIDVIHDSLPMFPFLLLTYIILEFVEHKDVLRKHNKLLSLQRFAPLFGALLGIIPQCGISVIASGLYVDGVVSLGTLLAVFISTSDEAIPILIANPEFTDLLVGVILIKLVIAIFIGYTTDILLKRFRHTGTEKIADISCNCDKDHGSLWKNALIRTMRIFLFVCLVNFVLSFLLAWIGDERLSSLLFDKSFLQPLFAALIGFIPNCVASVLLAQLYISNILSFGSLVAGLITSAGLGFMVLLKVTHRKREIVLIISILYLTAWLSGSLLQFFM